MLFNQDKRTRSFTSIYNTRTFNSVSSLCTVLTRKITSYKPIIVLQIFIRWYHCKWTCKWESRLFQSIPWHPVSFAHFHHIFPSKYWVRVQSPTSLLHFRLLSFPLILSTKYYFVKICDPCFLYFWHASSWTSATLPYSTHKSRTIILQSSCFADGWPWRMHTTNAPKPDVLLAVYFGPQSQIEISVSNCSRAKRSIYVPTELSYWCSKKLHPYQ